MLRVDDEPRNSDAIQNDQKREQAQQTRHDPGKPHRVKLSQTDALETSPPLQRPTRDQEPGNHEEHTDAVISTPKQYAVGRWANHYAERALVEMDTQVDVMQHDGNNAEPAKHVDALDTFVWLLNLFCGYCFRHRSSTPANSDS